jgi:cytochrome P450
MFIIHCNLTAQRDPTLWEDPDTFNPHRFLSPANRTTLFLDQSPEDCPVRPLFVALIRFYALELLKSVEWTPLVNPRENIHKLIPVPRPLDKFRVSLNRYEHVAA